MDSRDNMDLDRGGVKMDSGKLRFDLIPPWALEMLAAVFTTGAMKYLDRNWEKGMRWGRIFAALNRHLWAFWRGETVDPEDGISHMIHAAWCCIVLYEYWLHKIGQDDRSQLVPDPDRRNWHMSIIRPDENQ